MVEALMLMFISVALGYVVNKVEKLDEKVDKIQDTQAEMISNTRKRRDD